MTPVDFWPNSLGMEGWEIKVIRHCSWDELEAEQKRCIQTIESQNGRKFLLLSEPKPTLTAGRTAKQGDLLQPTSYYQNQQVQIVPVSRGGQWTYHGPGQILIFPLCRLSEQGWQRGDSKAFVDHFRSILLSVLQRLLQTSLLLKEHPYGIYHQGSKLASFGVDLRGGISRHGASLYYSSFFDWTQWIHPCGQQSPRFTSYQALGGELSWEELASELAAELKKSFRNQKLDL